MRNSKERQVVAHPASHCNSQQLSSSAEEVPSHCLAPKTSPPRGPSTSQPVAAARGYPFPSSSSSSGRGFLRGKFPFLLRRRKQASKQASKSPQGQAACRSRLCMEVTHESPIQAVRKPAMRGGALGLEPEEESLEGRVGPSLLRKLLCLKASSPHLHKPPRACARWGPVAALSRTADPQGESPLRWKPRPGSQNHPGEASSVAKPERTDAAERLEGLCVAKPWRTFRNMLASRAKKRDLPLGQQEDQRAARGGDLGLSEEAESPPASRAGKGSGQPQNCIVDDTTPLAAFPPNKGDSSGAPEEEGGHRSTQSHRKAGDLSALITEPALEDTSCLLSEETGRPEENPALESASDQRGPQTWVGGFLGGSTEEAEGGEGCWLEVVEGGEQQDLADLAENPGGQGMVMATRDLGWLSTEQLAGAGSRLGGQESVAQGTFMGEDAIWGKRSTEHTHAAVVALGPAADQTAGHNGTCSPPLGRQSDVGVLSPLDSSRAHTLQDARALLPGSLLETDPAHSLEPCGSFLPTRREGHQGPPTLNPGLLVPGAPAGQNGLGQGCSLQLAPAESEQERTKQLFYMAAVDIVGAAVDAAAAQVAKKEVQERAKS